jgi:hypothetical protein
MGPDVPTSIDSSVPARAAVRRYPAVQLSTAAHMSTAADTAVACLLPLLLLLLAGVDMGHRCCVPRLEVQVAPRQAPSS